jgi:spermidine/putrescine transport system ATP-binding protein/putrescine transport system ATP-binding protein
MSIVTGEAVGAGVLLALRPEKIVLSTNAPMGGVAGTVAVAAYLGERSHYTVAVAGLSEPISVSAQNTKSAATRGHTPGEAVYLSWAPDAVVLVPSD